MKLKNEEKSIEITIDSYEFPYHETNDFHDNNWLNVKAVCEDEVMVDDGISACLFTMELQELKEGLSKALVGKPYSSDYTEPDLEIEVIPKQETIFMRIAFALPNRYIFEVESDITKAQLDEMISDVSAMIKAFPIREKKILN